METSDETKVSVKGYKILETVADGGFGRVYRALQEVIGREVAVKSILPIHANNSDFARRFEVEAKLVARLAHPHIVPLYDFWRDQQEGAFLVMRWLDGGNLYQMLAERGALDFETIARLLDQITGALGFAHRAGVVHQDIKPANILLDKDGNAYLSDFGIALTDTGENLAVMQDSNLIHGSPTYISPEHLRQKVTAKSDIYSMGLLLYEMLAGEPLWAGLDPYKALKQRLKLDKLPSLQEINPDIPPEFNEIIWRATAKQPQQRYESIGDLAKHFRACMDGVGEEYDPYSSVILGGDFADLMIDMPIDPINPYKGLQAFDETDADIFFGRDTLINELSQALTDDSKYMRFLAVVSSSGTGKSSAVKAGLIPKIRKGEVAGLENSFIAQITPSARPFQRLQGAILSVAVRANDRLLNLLSTGEYKLAEIAEQFLPDDGSKFILIIDQFEELFTLVEDKDEQKRFLDLIYEAVVAPDSRVWVVITLRADFSDRPMAHAGFAKLLIQERVKTVTPMSGEELDKVIRGPASKEGLIFEEGLVGRILDDIKGQPGSLPLLQHTLMELFDRRVGLTLTLAAYDEIGGVSGALVTSANKVYDGFNSAYQKICKQLFLRLVSLGEGSEDTRQRTLLSDLRSIDKIDPKVMQEIIDRFGDFRLLSFDIDPETRHPTVEIAHEILIRDWRQLRTWLADNRDNLRIHARVKQAVREWQKNGKDNSFLASGVRLAQFSELEGAIALTHPEMEYFQKSVIAQNRRKARRAAAIAALAFLAVFASLMWYRSTVSERKEKAAKQEAINAHSTAVWERDRADLEARIAHSRELAAIASRDQEDLGLSLLLSLEALAIQDTFEARSTLFEVLVSQPRIMTLLNGHTDTVRSVIYSPDGRLIASASEDGVIIIWDAETMRPIGEPLYGHTGAINSLVFNANGTLLVSGGSDHQVLVWDVESREQAMEPLEKHSEEIWSLALSPDDKLLASAGEDNVVYLWDMETGEALDIVLEGHEQEIYALDFNHDGSILASGSADTTIRLWDMTTYESQVLEGHSNWVRSIVFRPDGKVLASGDANNLIYLWDMETGEQLSTLRGHTGWVRSLDFYGSGRLLMSGGAGGIIILWDSVTGQALNAFRSVGETDVWDVAFNPDADRRMMVTAGEDDVISAWYLDPQPALGKVLQDHTSEVLSVAYHPTQSIAASGGNGDDTGIRIWDMETMDVLMTLDGHSNGVSSLAFNTTQLASGGLDGQVIIWDIETGETLFTLEQEDAVFSLAYSRDGSLLAVGLNNGTISLYDTINYEVIERSFEGHSNRVASLDFTPDGSLLASGGRDRTIRLWDVASGEQVGNLTGHTDSIQSISFSPDGTLLASGSRDTTIRLWEVETRQQVGNPLSNHINWVQDVAFSANNEMLASASGDQSVILWDVASGRIIGKPLQGHSDWVNSVAFSADGNYLVSGGRDTRVISWVVGLDLWKTKACEMSNRSLTDDELRIYVHNAAIASDCKS